MTKLHKLVKRRVPGAARGFVVMLHPGDGPGTAMVEVREAGRRAGHSITIGGLYTILAWRAAEQAAAQKRAKRKAKGRGR